MTISFININYRPSMKTIKTKFVEMVECEDGYDGYEGECQIEGRRISFGVTKDFLTGDWAEKLNDIIEFIVTGKDYIIYKFAADLDSNGESELDTYNNKYRFSDTENGPEMIDLYTFCERCYICEVGLDDYGIMIWISNGGMFGSGVSEMNFSYEEFVQMKETAKAFKKIPATTKIQKEAVVYDPNTVLWSDYYQIGKPDRLKVVDNRSEVSYFIGQYLKSRVGGDEHTQIQHLAVKCFLGDYEDRSGSVDKSTLAQFLDKKFGNRKPKGSSW